MRGCEVTESGLVVRGHARKSTRAYCAWQIRRPAQIAPGSLIGERTFLRRSQDGVLTGAELFSFGCLAAPSSARDANGIVYSWIACGCGVRGRANKFITNMPRDARGCVRNARGFVILFGMIISSRLITK
jgi:hypothetical protein